MVKTISVLTAVQVAFIWFKVFVYSSSGSVVKFNTIALAMCMDGYLELWLSKAVLREIHSYCAGTGNIPSVMVSFLLCA